MIRWFTRQARCLSGRLRSRALQRFTLQHCIEVGRQEGWTVEPYNDGRSNTQRNELCCLDTMPGGGLPAFRCDVEAWRHVVARAQEGSLPHRAALRLLDPAERVLIETHCGSWSETEPAR